MSAPTSNKNSAYPFTVDHLLPAAQRLAVRLGEIPSRNRLKAELKIGAPKANAILTTLRESGFDPADPPAEVARLHLVTDADGGEVTSAPVTSVTSEPPAAVDTVPVRRPSRPVDVRPAGSTKAATHGPVPETSAGMYGAGDVSPAASVPASRSVPSAGDATPPAARPVKTWPLYLLAAPAMVAIWSGWVGLGGLTGFGMVHPLPGIWDSLTLNTAITLPVGMDTYAAYALRVWLSGSVPARARRFAKWSAIGSLVLGALGQVAYHLMAAAQMQSAPWQITTLVSCVPVAVFGMGAALVHLIRDNHTTNGEGS
jgi:hypothetical protein